MRQLTPLIIINSARSWIGTPYIHQASLKGVGCDCLGLLRGVWRECVGDEPEDFVPYTPDWAEAKGEETLAAAGFRHFEEIKIEDATAGDIVLFRWRTHVPAKHVGILSSRTTMIHAHGGVSVCEVPLSNWWKRRIAYAFRFKNLVS
jgi:NlpC/P60 family putative phage cell wall peptidase